MDISRCNPAMKRHIGVGSVGKVAGPLYKVRFTIQNRIDQAVDFTGAVLIVTGHDHTDLITLVSRPDVGRTDRRAGSTALGSLDEGHSSLADNNWRAVGRSII